ncbi:MAG: DUF790 family protein [Thermoproteota archaeon]
MLAAPLLRVTVRKGTIMPLFCTQSDELELTERILEEFQESFKAHERKSELYERISAIESSHKDYKLVRGLCALLERRCIFSANSYVVGVTTDAKSNDDDATASLEASSAINTASAVAIDPIDVRRMLFEESSKRGFALTELERDSIINSIAEKLHASSDDIKRAMWSDLDDNLVFEHFEYIDAKTLVGWYNLSLMQTLLFNATKMEFYVSGGGTHWKRILRNVKRLGLMYYLEDRSRQQQYDTEGQSRNHSTNNGNSFIVCSVEGPLSLFKLTDRYGTSLARLLPSIILLPPSPREECVGWQIDAWVLRKTMMQGKKLYQFKISSGETLPHLADPFYAAATTSRNNDTNKKSMRRIESSTSTEYYYSFDSTVEEKFARKFNEVVGEASGWKLVREPDPLILADGKAFIPDFMFEKHGKRVYLEIVGFWTPEYLERKLQKIKQIITNTNGSSGKSNHDCNTKSISSTADLFIAINEELAGSKISSPSFSSSSASPTSFSSSVPKDKLIFYKNDSVPIRPILDYLKALDKEMIDRKMKDPNLRIEVDRSKDIISLEDLAQKYDLPIEVVSKISLRDYGDQYISVSGVVTSSTIGSERHHHYLISKAKTKKLELQMKGVKTFTDACMILSKNAIPESCYAELVEKLGYKVIWRSMDISTAIIEERKNADTTTY